LILFKITKNKIQFHSKIGNSEFLAEKELFENDSISMYDSNLPSDLKSLEKLYETLAQNYAKNFQFKIESGKLIEKDSLKGYHLKLTDSINYSINEIEYFLLNKNIYLFKYKTPIELKNNEKERFFNSVKIYSDKKINQFLGIPSVQKSAYNFGYKIGSTVKKHPSYLWIAGGLFMILIIGIIVFYIKRK
jgi:hypothetical protein